MVQRNEISTLNSRICFWSELSYEVRVGSPQKTRHVWSYSRVYQLLEIVKLLSNNYGKNQTRLILLKMSTVIRKRLFLNMDQNCATWVRPSSVVRFFAGPKQILQIEPLFGYDIWSDLPSPKQSNLLKIFFRDNQQRNYTRFECYAPLAGQMPHFVVKCTILGSLKSWIRLFIE